MPDISVVADRTLPDIQVVVNQGLQGAKGDTGEVGPQGPAGVGNTGPTGPAGATGPAGDDGRGIVSIERTSGTGAPGTADTYTITYTDATSQTYTVYNGADGSVGNTGPQGPAGATGPAGAIGPTGDDGRGIVSIERTSGTGAPGTADTYTITYTDATSQTYTVYNGADGSGSGDMLKSVYDPDGDGVIAYAQLAGVAAAIHNHDANYAPIAKGVTNGDSHDHSGGDGAQIAYGSLSGVPSSFTPASHATTSHSDWPSTVSMTEVGYLDGVTSAIQTQLNGKQASGTYVTSVSGTAPVSSSGGTTPAISMAAANGSTNGYLTSADWTTFNGKQAALVSGSNIKTINSTSLLGSGDIVISSGSTTLTIDNKTSAYTVVAGDNGKVINCTSGMFTVSLTAAATLGAGFNCWIWNTSTTATHSVSVVPSGSEKIDYGITSYSIFPQNGVQLVCTGTGWVIASRRVGAVYDGITIGNGARAGSSLAISIGNGANSSGAASFCGGYNTVASSNYSVAIGLNSSGNASQAVTGSGAMALGGSYASGTDSFAAAIGTNSSSYGALGNYSIAMGSSSVVTAAGSYGVAIGYGASVSGQNAVVLGGNNCAATGAYATSLGGGFNMASGSYSAAMGYYSTASLYGKFSYASGRFATAGDAQRGVFVLRTQTATATPAVLTADGSAAAAYNQVVLPNDSTYAFSIIVVARRTDADNESAGYKFEGVIDRNGSAATTALVGSVTKTVLAEDTAAWDVNVTADTTNGGLAVTVTGEAAKTIRWVATVMTSEVTG